MASSGRSSSQKQPQPQRFPKSMVALGNANPSVSQDDIAAAQILSAATEGDIPRVRKLAERLKMAGKGVEAAAVKDPPYRRRGPLHMAAWAGRLEMCKFLIKDLHLDVNTADDDGVTPLIFAIYGSGSTAVVRLLLDHGADPNKADRNGLTALHTATFQDNCEIAELLLSRGAYVDPVFEKGAPLHVAAEDGNGRMLELLLRHQADPNRVVSLFYTPLTVAIFASSLECVELLIKAGADVNAGRPVTPLVVAASDNLTDCIKCLLEAGADANIPDESGRMPLEIAAIHGWKECVEILFPLTSPVARFADWSIDGIIQHAEFGSSKTKDRLLHENDGSALKAQGDAAFQEKDYAHASALYTMGRIRRRAGKKLAALGEEADGRRLGKKLAAPGEEAGSARGRIRRRAGKKPAALGEEADGRRRGARAGRSGRRRGAGAGGSGRRHEQPMRTSGAARGRWE